jgi:hypothetical protein
LEDEGEHQMVTEVKDKCGDCRNFTPKTDEKFFNCTAAKHSGLRYGMQVRADTRACEALAPR